MESRFSSARLLLSALSAFSAVSALIVSAYAQAPDRGRAEALARRAAARLQSLQREADRLASDERTLINDVRALEIQRRLKAEDVKRIDADVKKVQDELDATAQRMATLEATEKKQTPEFRARLVEIYKLGQGRYLRMVLSTADLRQLAQSTRTVAALAKIDHDRIESHVRTIDQLRRAGKTLATRRAELATLRGAAEKAQAAVLRAEQAKNDLIREIDRKRDLNAQLTGELLAAQLKLQAALRDLSSGAAAEPVSLPLKPFRGDLEWPAAGTVTRRFGRGVNSNGIEISTPDDAEARAVHDGVVAFAGTFAGFGNLVILDHGSQNFSLYGDLLDIVVNKGMHLDRGQPVGAVGPTSSGGNGLYFELRVDGQPVDPLQWLKKR